jgi:hypothetical protein
MRKYNMATFTVDLVKLVKELNDKLDGVKKELSTWILHQRDDGWVINPEYIEYLSEKDVEILSGYLYHMNVWFRVCKKYSSETITLHHAGVLDGATVTLTKDELDEIKMFHLATNDIISGGSDFALEYN